MHRSSGLFFVACAACTSAASGGSTLSSRASTAAAPTVLVFGAYGLPRPFTAAIDVFAAEVLAETEGAVVIESDFSGSQNDLLDSVARGDFDGGIWAGGNIVTRTPLQSVTVLPGLSESGEAIAEANLHLARMPVMQDALRDAGCSGGVPCDVVWVAPLVVPAVGVVSACEVATVLDLEGVPVRTFGGNTALLDDLGAEARPIGQGAVFTGMLAYLGLLDPIPNPPPVQVCGGLTSWPATQKQIVFDPWCQYVYGDLCENVDPDDPTVHPYFQLYANRELGIGANAFQLIMNGAVWDGLSPSTQAAMREAAEGVPAAHAALTTADDQALETLFEAFGMQIDELSADDLEVVHDAADRVQADWVCDSLVDAGTKALVLQSAKAFLAELAAIDAVEALRDDGSLSRRSAGRLEGKLSGAIEAGEQADVGHAVELLQAFLAGVDDVVGTGELSDADAQAPRQEAMNAIAALESIPAIAASCD